MSDAPHYSPAVACGGFVFVSGQLPVCAADRLHLVGAGIAEQVRQTLENVEAALASFGADRTHIVKATVFVSDIGQWDDVNRAYARFFGAHKPARTIIPTGTLHFGFDVEIEAVACLGGASATPGAGPGSPR